MGGRTWSILPMRRLATGIWEWVPATSWSIQRDFDESRVRRIWKRAVIPYIEEQFFGNEDRLAEFEFDALRAELPYGVNGSSDSEVPLGDGKPSRTLPATNRWANATPPEEPVAIAEGVAAGDADNPTP